MIKWALQISVISLMLAGCASSSNVYEVQPGVYAVTAAGDGYTTANRVMDLTMGKAQQACVGDVGSVLCGCFWSAPLLVA